MQKSLFSSKELKVIQQAKSLKVLVIGDSCVDKFIYGTCNRLSPEAPVPVLKHTLTKEMPGMAGNVVQNVRAFCDRVKLSTQTHEITKVRYVDVRSNQHIMRFDTEPDSDMQRNAFSAASKDAKAAIAGDYDIVILSDYNKGFIHRNHIRSLTSMMTQTVYVDSKKSDISCFKNSIIKLNEKEFETAGNTKSDCSDVIVTLGAAGAAHGANHFRSEPAEVFDVSGAGDTFLASFSVFHSVTGDIPASIVFANKCAGIVVQHKGTYAISRSDLSR